MLLDCSGGVVGDRFSVARLFSSVRSKRGKPSSTPITSAESTRSASSEVPARSGRLRERRSSARRDPTAADVREKRSDALRLYFQRCFSGLQHLRKANTGRETWRERRSSCATSARAKWPRGRGAVMRLNFTDAAAVRNKPISATAALRKCRASRWLVGVAGPRLLLTTGTDPWGLARSKFRALLRRVARRRTKGRPRPRLR